MNDGSLEIEFREAVERVNTHPEPFPADLLLRLYAYYKRATNDYSKPSGRRKLINAFKTNALFQVRDISIDEAKREYITLVNNYLLYRE